jgi:hypothetical protein
VRVEAHLPGATIAAQTMTVVLTGRDLLRDDVDLRALAAHGVGTAIAASTVRRHIRFLAGDATVPDLESLVEAVRGRAFSRSDPSSAGLDATHTDR